MQKKRAPGHATRVFIAVLLHARKFMKTRARDVRESRVADWPRAGPRGPRMTSTLARVSGYSPRVTTRERLCARQPLMTFRESTGGPRLTDRTGLV